MSLQVRWTDAAERDMRGLARDAAARVLRGVIRFAEAGTGNVKALRGSEELRLRVGDWRVRFTIDRAAETLLVLRVLHRREAYR